MVANSGQDYAPGPGWNEVWGRLRQATGMNTQRELARSLAISDASVADAKRRGYFPFAWIYRLGLKYEISFDFILCGQKQPPNVVSSEGSEGLKPIYIDTAVELVEEAANMSECHINSEQKAALVKIIREELKKKAENLVKALTV